MSDGHSESTWQSSALLDSNSGSHAVIMLDGGPKTISMVINGAFDDSGETRQFGFGLFQRFFQSPNGRELGFGAGLGSCMLYSRALLSAEACALFGHV